MKGMWLGQAGFLLEVEDGTTVMIDPYLSNSLEERYGSVYHRAVPLCTEYIRSPDILVLTHCHEDHMDLATLDRLFGEKRMTVLAPFSVFSILRERYPGKAEYILFTPGTEVTLGSIRFRAVFAAHSDPDSIGVVLYANGKTVYHTGDTLYHQRVLDEAAKHPDLLILPINGKGNNMNPVDAARMTKVLAPVSVLPMHWELFPELGCDVSLFTSQLSGAAAHKILIPEHFYYFDI